MEENARIREHPETPSPHMHLREFVEQTCRVGKVHVIIPSPVGKQEINV